MAVRIVAKLVEQVATGGKMKLVHFFASHCLCFILDVKMEA